MAGKNRTMEQKHALARKWAGAIATRESLSYSSLASYGTVLPTRRYDTLSYALGYSARAKAARAAKLAAQG